MDCDRSRYSIRNDVEERFNITINCAKLLDMNRLTQLKAKLRAAQAELAIRTRTHNSASRAYNKVTAHITELEKRIADLEKISK